MTTDPSRRLRKILLIILGCISILCIGALGISLMVNRRLPTQSSVVETLSEPEKARLAEAAHLRGTLGEQVWQGWEQQTIPFIVYNEKYAFLVGYPGDPPDGWVMMPSSERRGGVWEVVPGDDFQGADYYRQELRSADKTPENFTVQVGDLWVATLMTKEFGAVSFYQGFRDELPPVIRDVFPYKLMWNQLGGESGGYINALEHESFHSYQAVHSYASFARAEEMAGMESSYPWEDEELEVAWKAELEALSQAREIGRLEDAVDLAVRFLELRDERRSLPGYDRGLSAYEQRREWLEGLAKYAELTLAYQAATTPDYEPLGGMAEDLEFRGYARQEGFYRQQFSEVARMSGREGETRFYYSGFAQAVLLDHLMPDWKPRAMQGETLEVLLREAVGE